MTTFAPKVSILMAAYNAIPFIEEAVHSVLRQTVSDWELIIVDDGSTDGTSDYLESFASDQRFRSLKQDNAGPSIARERALNLARGKYVLYLDADDRIFPDTVERLSKALDDAPDAVAVYGYKVRISADGKPLQDPSKIPPYTPLRDGHLTRHLLVENHISLGSIMCRKDALDKVDSQTEQRYGEDWLIWARLSAVGPFKSIGPPAVLEHRSHSSGSNTYSTLTDLDHRQQTVDQIYATKEIKKEFSASELKNLRKRCDAILLRNIGIRLLAARNYSEARRWLAQSVRRNPFAPISWAMLVIALLQFVPPSVANRIGSN